MDPIRSNKILLIEILSTDASYILQHVHQKRLITQREYTRLQGLLPQDAERSVIELLDKIMGKDDEHCHRFIDVLGEERILENYPKMKMLHFKKERSAIQEIGPSPTTDDPFSVKSSDQYKMTSVPLGTCLIINNENFSGKPPRQGSKQDADYLGKVFNWLGFSVELLKDQTASDMETAVKAASLKAQGDCFVCCVLSHGNEKGIQGCKGEELSVEKMLSPLKGTNCPRLAGKPKLFFIQACRGDGNQRKVLIEADHDDVEIQGFELDADPVKISIPDDADFLVSMSTVSGCFSIRNKITGSWFIQYLCKQLEEGVSKGDDILTILTRVNNDVSCQEGLLRGGREVKQMPEQTVRLRKKLIFPVPMDM